MRRIDPDCLTYTVPEAAKLVGIGETKAYDLVARGELPAKKLGRRWVVPKSLLPQWVETPNNGFKQNERS